MALVVHGHRGARARYPENTLPAFEYAMKIGADYLEMDMAVTKDRQIVISHDPHISKLICLDPEGRHIKKEPLIHSLTLDEVQKYDCGTLKNPRFDTQTPIPKTKKPTLNEVFEMVENSNDVHSKTVKFNIETKIFADHPEYSTTPEDFIALFYDVVKKHHMEKRVVLQSFDYRTLEAMRRVDPKIILSALVERTALTPRPDLVAVAKKTGAEILSPESETVTAANVKSLHAMNVQVHPWTVDKPEEWKRLIDLGVDGIITDDPEALIKYLKTNRSDPT